MLSELPKVDRVVAAPELALALRRLGPKAVTALVRSAIARARARVKDGHEAPTFEALVTEVRSAAERRERARLTRVVNATGVVLHTNLGRAPLPAAAQDRVGEISKGYCTLELDAETGVRTRRGLGAELTFSELVSAEDTLFVNNNAAGVLLALSSIAAGKEVIVSRGELVEIGGGFRIPEVLARSGARLVEVGTTNRTRVDDYQRAIGEHTACLLRVHPSNFKISGFTERPNLSALAAVAHDAKLPLIKDLGGGLVVELGDAISGSDLAREPSVQACLGAGADLVCVSLDKLFGGPQAGAIAGRGKLVERLRADPLARALRIDKLAIAAIEGVLDCYVRGQTSEIPVHALLATPVTALEERVKGWQAALGEHGPPTEVLRTEGAIGGGTLAEAPVSSVALSIRVADPDALAARLRSATPPVIGRVGDGALLLDARSVFPDEDALLVAALVRALEPSQKA